MLTKLVWPLILTFFAALFVSQALAMDTDLVIGVGHSRLLNAPNRLPVAVANGRILAASDLGRRIKIMGKKKGRTTLTIGPVSRLIHVLDDVAFREYQRLERDIQGRRGLTLDVVEGTPSITGRLLRFSDWESLSRRAQGAWNFAATLDAELTAKARAWIDTRLSQAGLAPAPIRFGAPVSVSLAPERKEIVNRYKEILEPLGVQVAVDGTAIALEPLVRVQIVVAELRKKVFERLGILWPGQANAQLLPRWQAPGQLTPIELQLQALEENGLGKVLASPNLLCRSGKEAEFLAGGEFPIKIANFKTHDVIWKKYGVLLKIKPKADFSGRMSIGLETEVSMIDTSQTVDGIPGLLTNRIESHFDLEGKKTIALSGLIKKEWGRSTSGLPGLSNLPILGLLFSSNEFRRQETELIVFVTPEVLSDASQPVSQTAPAHDLGIGGSL